MLVHIFIDLLCMTLSWYEIRYRTFHPAPSSVSGLQLLSDDSGAMRGQLVPAAGAAADSHDQKGLFGAGGQVWSSPGGWCRGRNRRGGISPCPEPCAAPWEAMACIVGGLCSDFFLGELTWKKAPDGPISKCTLRKYPHLEFNRYRVDRYSYHLPKNRVPDMGWRKKTETKNSPHVSDSVF